MDAVFALVLPLVGGFFVIREATFVKYKAAREDGHRLYFRIVYYGTWLLIWSYLLLYGVRAGLMHLDWYPPFEVATVNELRQLLKDGQQDRARLGFVIACFVAMLLGRLAPHLANKVTRKSSLDALIEAVSQNEFEELLVDAVTMAKSVLITLTSGKVYAGFVLTTPEPRTERRVLALLPLISGYRSETHQVVFTTFYDEIYAQDENADDGNFRLIIPIDKILSAAFFDPVIYEKFNSPELSLARDLTVESADDSAQAPGGDGVSPTAPVAC